MNLNLCTYIYCRKILKRKQGRSLVKTTSLFAIFQDYTFFDIDSG